MSDKPENQPAATLRLQAEILKQRATQLRAEADAAMKAAVALWPERKEGGRV